jgi:dynein heavy chain
VLDNNQERVQDFLEQLEKFVKSLVGARENLEGHVTLADSDASYAVDGLRTVADYQAAGKHWRFNTARDINSLGSSANNSEMHEKLEELLATWSKQIEQVLAESEQIRREADDIGPTAELSYWKTRMAKFNT